MKQGEWKTVREFPGAPDHEVREDPLDICSLSIFWRHDHYRMYEAWNQWFIETSDNLDALKKTADEIYRHRVANYLWVLKKRAENVQKDIELAEWLLKEDAVTE